MRGKSFRLLLLLVTVLFALGVAGCGGDDDEGEAADTGAADTGGGAAGGTLVFGTAADPVVLDGALVSDGESLRVDRPDLRDADDTQAGDHRDRARACGELGRLRRRARVHVPPAPGRDVPRRRALQRRGGLLQLRPLVQLHGLVPEPERLLLLADRLRRVREDRAGQRRARGQPLQELRGSRREHGRDHAHEAVVLGPRRASPCPRSGSPARRRSRNSARTRAPSTRTGSSTRRGRSAPSIPSAPARSSSTRGSANDKLTLVRNDDYWGDKAKLDSVIFRPIPDNAARLQALQTGEIQGYDLVEPQDIETIESDELPDPRPPGVQRRLRRDQPGDPADGQARGQAGDRRTA